MMIFDASRIISPIGIRSACWCIAEAPACLPSPITNILAITLSYFGETGMRLDAVNGDHPVSVVAVFVRKHGKPGRGGSDLNGVHVERIGQPTLSSVIP